MSEADGPAFEARLGHRFGDPSLLDAALTHASAAREADGSRGNERLEFLGDAVLDVIVSRGLYEVHPDWPEGDLSRTRSGLVNAASLAARARALGLPDAVRLGRTELRSGGRQKDSILANTLEAVIAAVYLDGGLPAAEALVRRVFPEAFDPGREPGVRDPKTRLNEWALGRGGEPPRYLLVGDAGEEGGAERFRVEVHLAGAALGAGVGATKQGAERAAAEAALRHVGADAA